MKVPHSLKIQIPELDELNEKNDFNDDEYFNRFIEKTRQSRWRIYRPSALTRTGWRKWDEAMEEQFPIRNWFHNKFVRFFQNMVKRISWRTRDAKCAFLHRFVKKHQYHVLRPKTLSPGYYDPDTRILHGMMEELRKFYETGANNIEWESDDLHSDAYKEMTAIYDWWVNEYPNRAERLNQTHPLPDRPSDIPNTFGWMMDDDFKDHPASIEWSKISKERFEIEESWHKEEEEMLIRLIKIRAFLWYV